ncbi:hypothetical protein NDA01_23840 [Trichocoleus desertorum AS-A10]|uniref:hypothetical protein n=1 Tax=Trichocoleus desertorum TaxID=1481672 RepID=UPI00329695BF
MSMHQTRDRHKYAILSWAVLLSSLTETLLGIPTLAQGSSKPANQLPLPPAYVEAIEDAKLAEPQEIYRNLTPIVWYNPALVWDRSRVLVTVWTTYSGYTSRVGGLMRLPLDLWVTAAPDLQNFCKTYRPTQEVSLAYRLNQLLGLPPDAANQPRSIVELWVEPRHLFRPTPDPDISDREATLEFPLNEFATTPPSYQEWFSAQFASRYPTMGKSYPWTQLGYTYDWGSQSDWQRFKPNHPAQVGLSEFVVRQGAQVTVRSTQRAEAYCR